MARGADPIDFDGITTEFELKVAEAKLKYLEFRRARRRDSLFGAPLTLSVIGAALALAGNIVVATINGSNTIAAERGSTRSALLVESLRTGDPEESLKMLQLLNWLELIEVPGDVLQGYREDPETTPFLPVSPGPPPP